MKNLLILILLAAAAWYGWHHWRDLLKHVPNNQAVIVNNTGHEMQRVRLSVGEQSLGVKETIVENASAQFPFQVSHDGAFTLVWQYADRPGEQRWTGGSISAGPIVQKCTFTVDADNQVIFMPTNLGGGP